MTITAASLLPSSLLPLASSVKRQTIAGVTAGRRQIVAAPNDVPQAADSSGAPDRITLSSESQTLSAQVGPRPSSHTQTTSPTPSESTDSVNNDVYSMTNAQLVTYANSKGLSDVANSFQVDYAPADRSAAGEATFYQSLMADPTPHNFVEQFEQAASWQLQHGSTSGYDDFEKMANELVASSTKVG